MTQPVEKSQQVPREAYKFLIDQVFAEYDETGVGNYFKIVQFGYEQDEAMLLVDTDGVEHHYTAAEVADKLMSREWGSSTEAEFQQRKENIGRIEYNKFRRSQRQPSPIGTATVTIRADTSDYDEKMDKAITKLKEFIALSEKANQYK